jgi:hypothetical protein
MKALPSQRVYAERAGFDLDLAKRECSEVAILRATHDRGFFWLDEEGEESAIIGVTDENGEPLDMVAWPLADPELFSVAHGYAAVLGARNVINQASWAFGAMLRVWRSPLAWLKDECRGVVVLDYKSAGVILRHALGPMLCEDDVHCLDVDAAVNPQRFHFAVFAPPWRLAA